MASLGHNEFSHWDLSKHQGSRYDIHFHISDRKKYIFKHICMKENMFHTEIYSLEIQYIWYVNIALKLP